MTEMIERVARAIAVLRWRADDYPVWDALGNADREECFNEARAAIEEIIIVLQEYGEPQAASVLRDKELEK